MSGKNREVKNKFLKKSKAIAVSVATAILLTSGVTLGGCVAGKDGENGKDGVDGATWYRDTANIDTVDYGKAGDFYVDTDDYKLYQKNEDGSWTLVIDNFGKAGEDGKDGVDGASGSNGNAGSAGENGESPYIGYDGYFWYGTDRSEHQAINVTNKYLADNTIGLIGNEYFESYTLSADTSLALMNYYFPTIEKTGYSGVVVSKIQIYVDTAGTLTFGTVSVGDVKNRTGSGVDIRNAVQKTVVKGLNEIVFDKPIEVPTTDTLTVGKSGDTAKLVCYRGIVDEQIQGSFASLTKSASGGVIEKTNGVNDKLIIKVETNNVYTGDFIDGFDTKIMKYSQGWNEVLRDYTPLVYKNKTLFENTTINYITAMTKSVNAINDNQYITVKLVDVDSSGGLSVKATYQFKARVSDLGSDAGKGSLNCLINYYPDQPIYVGAGQTLSFYDGATDPVNICFKKGQMGEGSNSSMGVGFYYSNWDNEVAGENIAINVNVTKTVGKNFGDNIVSLAKQENDSYAEQTLSGVLNGKYLSILGDSISTYNGYSNSTANNDTIGDNVYYGDITSNMSVNDTYWKQTIDRYNMKLLVDNAWSGSTISDARGYGAWGARCVNLHANRGTLNGTKPDVIILYMGINDLYCNYAVQTVGLDYDWSQFTVNAFTPDTFDEAYACAIYKMQNAYPDADIFCFTIPKSSQGDGIDDALLQYNDAIKNIASHYGCQIVDIYSTVLSDNFTSSKYTLDNLHPNAGGMDVMTQTLVEALKEFYVK